MLGWLSRTCKCNTISLPDQVPACQIFVLKKRKYFFLKNPKNLKFCEVCKVFFGQAFFFKKKA